MTDNTPDACARLIARIEDAKRNERHRTRQETMYWFRHYKEMALAAADLLRAIEFNTRKAKRRRTTKARTAK